MFYKLSSDQDGAQQWLGEADIAESIRNKAPEWFVDGLQNWDITRDAPYFGVNIPGRENQYFYVWLDAPFGYMTAFARALGLEKYTGNYSEWNEYSVQHFIGKMLFISMGYFGLQF